jgi:hypothetical protein
MMCGLVLCVLLGLIAKEETPNSIVIHWGGKVNRLVPKIIAARNHVIYEKISRLIRGVCPNSLWLDAKRPLFITEPAEL